MERVRLGAGHHVPAQVGDSGVRLLDAKPGDSTRLNRRRIIRAAIAGVAGPVAIDVGLIGVEGEGAVVAGVADAVGSGLGEADQRDRVDLLPEGDGGRQADRVDGHGRRRPAR